MILVKTKARRANLVFLACHNVRLREDPFKSLCLHDNIIPSQTERKKNQIEL